MSSNSNSRYGGLGILEVEPKKLAGPGGTATADGAGSEVEDACNAQEVHRLWLEWEEVKLSMQLNKSTKKAEAQGLALEQGTDELVQARKEIETLKKHIRGYDYERELEVQEQDLQMKKLLEENKRLQLEVEKLMEKNERLQRRGEKWKEEAELAKKEAEGVREELGQVTSSMGTYFKNMLEENQLKLEAKEKANQDLQRQLHVNKIEIGHLKSAAVAHKINLNLNDPYFG